MAKVRPKRWQSLIVLALNAIAAIWVIAWLIVFMAPSDFIPLWSLWVALVPSMTQESLPTTGGVLLQRVIEFVSFVPAVLFFIAAHKLRTHLKAQSKQQSALTTASVSVVPTEESTR